MQKIWSDLIITKVKLKNEEEKLSYVPESIQADF